MFFLVRGRFLKKTNNTKKRKNILIKRIFFVFFLKKTKKIRKNITNVFFCSGRERFFEKKTLTPHVFIYFSMDLRPMCTPVANIHTIINNKGYLKIISAPLGGGIWRIWTLLLIFCLLRAKICRRRALNFADGPLSK